MREKAVSGGREGRKSSHKIRQKILSLGSFGTVEKKSNSAGRITKPSDEEGGNTGKRKCPSSRKRGGG